MSCNHHHSLFNYETFLSPQENNLVSIEQWLPVFIPTHLALATTNLASVSVELPILDISRKWNHIIYALFPQRFQIRLCCSMRQYFIRFYGWITSILWTDCILFVHSSIGGHSDCFHIWPVNGGATDIHVQVYLEVLFSVLVGVLSFLSLFFFLILGVYPWGVSGQILYFKVNLEEVFFVWL